MCSGQHGSTGTNTKQFNFLDEHILPPIHAPCHREFQSTASKSDKRIVLAPDEVSSLRHVDIGILAGQISNIGTTWSCKVEGEEVHFVLKGLQHIDLQLPTAKGRTTTGF